MSIMSSLEIIVEYKIESVDIDIVGKTITIKVRKLLKNGDVVMSSFLFAVMVTGADFLAMAAHIPEGDKNLYGEIGEVAYTYCITHGKFQ